LHALLPDALLPDAWRLQERTGLLVDRSGCVQALLAEGELPAGRWQRFPGETWCAAPSLAHAHVESHDAPSDTFRRAPFAAWVEDLVAWRRSGNGATTVDSAQAVHAELRAAGCGTVLALIDARDPLAAGARMDRSLLGDGLPESLIAAEFLAPDPGDAPAYVEHATAQVRAGRPVALHAPFSVSEVLATRVFEAAGGRVPVSLHLGEHPEERALLAGKATAEDAVEGTAALTGLMGRLGDARKRGHWSSPVDWLAEVGGLRPGTLAAHCGDLDAGELRRLWQAGVQVVHCPGTHAWFGRPRPAFVEAGVPLPALGCDSRASNDALDPLRELGLALASMPEPGPQAWWHAATATGAAALGRTDLGALLPGRRLRALRVESVAGERAVDTCARLAARPRVLGLLDGAAC
jgi:cytosine/adenosine deaminase-related metal-dependent hydrolase